MTASDFALIFVVSILSVFAVGCGSEALQINGEIARGMLELQAESGPLIREARVNAGVEAGRQAHANGLPLEVAQDAATSAVGAWDCAVSGHQIYAMNVGAYIDSLELARIGGDFSLATFLPFFTRALDAYRVLSSCLRGLGSDFLPEVPGFLESVPPVWGLQ